MIESLEAMRDEALMGDYKRCIEGEPMLWLPHTRALMPGHIYSQAGAAEARISGSCEYHFDRWFKPGWTDPVTGEPGDTPSDDSDAAECQIVGPYLPAGETEWRCTTHHVDAALKPDVERGLKTYRRDDFICPVADKEADQ